MVVAQTNGAQRIVTFEAPSTTKAHGQAPSYVRVPLVERLLPTVKSRVLHVLLRHKRREQVAQVVDDLTQQVFLLLFEAGGRRLRA